MAGWNRELHGMSIVAIGNFNPPIFQPAWFDKYKLIRPSEAEGATIEITHPEMSAFHADWLHLRVTRSQFVVETNDPAHVRPLKDLVIALFDLLQHTPVTHLGVNHQSHLKIDSQALWHEFGHLVLPKELWTQLLRNPGLRTVLVEGTREDGLTGAVRVKVEPSVRILPFGVYIEVNDEFKMTDQHSTEELTKILQTQWEMIRERAETILNQLLKLFEELNHGKVR